MNRFENISQKADVCVKCGFCLPACPTYQLSQQEADSPRGRISLVQSIVDEDFSIQNNFLQTHLQTCLTCRACETVCPAKVEYAEIIDFAKQVLPKSFFRRFLLFLMTNGLLVWFLSRLIYVYQHLGVAWLVARLGGLNFLGRLGRMESYLPKIKYFSKLKHFYLADNPKGSVGLFLGCIAHEFDRKTALDSIRLLNWMGYNVYLPKGQTCCGAMHEHAGMPDQAKKFKAKNHQIFGSIDVEAVLYTATGCAESLKKSLSVETMEIGQFVFKQRKHLNFHAVSKRVFLHLPCTQRNVLKMPDLFEELLNLIPDLTVQPLSGNEFCCGAAGLNMFEHPEIAEKLRDQKLTSLANESLDTLVTSNIGCSLHFSAGLRKKGLNVSVLHPVSLVYESVVET